MILSPLSRPGTQFGPLGLIDNGFAGGSPMPLGLGLSLAGDGLAADPAPALGHTWSPLDHEDSLPRFAPLHEGQGFDDTTQPHWQMVPLGGTRDVVLHLPVGREQFIVTSTRPDVAAVRYDEPGVPQGTVRIEGLRGRSCAIEVHDARGRLRTRLEVTVKDTLRRAVTFLTLSDHDGAQATGPFGAGSPVAQLVAGVNDIFLPQANIAIEATEATIRALDVDRRLGRKLSRQELDRHVYPALMDAGPEGMPVLFVRDYEDRNVGRSSVNGIFRRHEGSAGAIVLDAKSDHIVSTLAHEIGHFLISHSQYRFSDRRETHSPRREDLMYAHAPHGTRLRKDDVTVMNVRGLS